MLKRHHQAHQSHHCYYYCHPNPNMMIIVTTKTSMTKIMTIMTIMTTIPITLRSKEAKVVPADQKILIDAINKFQVMKKNKLFFCVLFSQKRSMYKPDRDRGQTLKSSRPVSRRWTPMTTLSPRPYMDRFLMIFTQIKKQ